jgi:hypothetical protein
MKRISLIIILGSMLFLAGVAAHAQVTAWGWWGATQATIVPVSAANPLPVKCL